MEGNWISLFCEYDHGPAARIVNLGPRDDGIVPDPQRPSSTLIRVKFNDAGPAGLGSDADADVIDTAWDSIQPEVMSGLGTEVMGRLRHQGIAKILLYSPLSSRQKIEVLAKRIFPGHSIEIEHRDDPHWEQYRAWLPTPAEERSSSDYLVVAALQEAGDPLTPKRDVQHFALFPDRERAEAFAKAIASQGFGIEVEQIEGETTWRVAASRDDSVEHPQISEITGALAELAERLGGEYDGWEAMLVKKKKGFFGKLFGR